MESMSVNTQATNGEVVLALTDSATDGNASGDGQHWVSDHVNTTHFETDVRLT
jgi:hypothetical protein